MKSRDELTRERFRVRLPGDDRDWLATGEPPAVFSVDRECELKSNDEEKSVVKFTRHNLLNDEIRHHVAQGKLPVKLALSWDGRVAFVLTEALQLKKVSFLEGVFDGTSAGKEDGFDADVAIATGELRSLIPDLIEALGGESERGMGAAPASDSSPATAQPTRASSAGTVTGPATAPPDTDPDSAPF
mgnify:CR=1 FL=1